MRSLLLAATLAASSSALSHPLFAEDARITATGTVTSIPAGGLGSPLFQNAAVGDAMALTFDVEFTRQLPFGDFEYAVNWPTSRITIGNSTVFLAPSEVNDASIGNDLAAFGDSLFLAGQLAGDPDLVLQLGYIQFASNVWNTTDFRDLYGMTLPLPADVARLDVSRDVRQIEVDLDTIRVDAAPGGPLGTPYCSAVPNSTGVVGATLGFGLAAPAQNDFNLIASGLPTQTFGYFLVSPSRGFVAGPGGSSGNLCLSGPIGRFVASGQILATDFAGEIAIPVDLTELPSPTGPLAVQAGQTWNFQFWHRDASPSGATSNFTRGLEVTF
ncbi:MAG: hypothetical protein AAGB93_20100 [Planctomycetota bacterium]